MFLSLFFEEVYLHTHNKSLYCHDILCVFLIYCVNLIHWSYLLYHLLLNSLFFIKTERLAP